jgi:DNA-binding NarL/FixJ family response regulator
VTGSSPLKVLIVEDEILVGWGLESALREQGHEVCGLVESADEAIALAEAIRPDLVLMDVGLYGRGDGLSAAREIMRRRPTRIVFSSSWNDEATLQAIAEIGPYANVPKPCRIQDILEVVGRAAAEMAHDND